MYLRARSLDTGIGRFLSADSFFPNMPGTQGYNLYSYAGNNPATWTDPTGHDVAGIGNFVAWVLLLTAFILWFYLVVCHGYLGCKGSTGPVTQETPEDIRDAPTVHPETPGVETPAPGSGVVIHGAVGRQPTKSECATAKKLLTEFDRLAERRGAHLSPGRITDLKRKRDAGIIEEAIYQGD